MPERVELTIHKAQGISEPITDAVITIRDEIPDFSREADCLRKLELYADADAAELEDLLINMLPGATYDRLLGRMLARKSTHFAVAHGARE